MKKIISIIILLAVCASFFACTPESGAPALKTESFELGQGELAYFFARSMQSTLASYSNAELAELGYDKSRSPFDQTFSENSTWGDLFMKNAIDYAGELLLLCEAAREAGIFVTPDDKLDEKLEKFKAECQSKYSVSFDTYLEAAFYGYTDEAAYRHALELEILANKYLDALSDRLFSAISNERAEAYISEKIQDPDRSLTKNVAVILLTGEAADKAEEIFTLLSSRDFLDVAKEFSESRELLYENCRLGDMDAKIDAWLYSAERKLGDIGQISTRNALFIVKYISDGMPVCLLEAKTTLAKEDYAAHLAALAQKFPIKKNQNVIDSFNV